MHRLASRIARAGLFVLLIGLGSLVLKADPIQGQDVNGRSVDVNGKGHYTVVLYTNPDLEDESRADTLALDEYRSRSDFALIRVVDLRGDIPSSMRGIVRGQIRSEMVKEDKRLKKQRGIVDASSRAPIIPDFSGSTLDALGWSSVYTQIHLVVYDTHGKEVKRLADVSDPKQLSKVIGDIL